MALSVGVGLVTLLLPLSALPVAVRLVIRGAAYVGLLAGVVLATGMLQPDEKELLWLPLRYAVRLFRRKQAGAPSKQQADASDDSRQA